jgi:hypothetical protein
MACKTCEPPKPTAQAEPVEAAIPHISNITSNASPSIYLKLTFKILETALASLPFIITSGIFFIIPSFNLSLKNNTRLSFSSKLAFAISNALAIPTM